MGLSAAKENTKNGTRNDRRSQRGTGNQDLGTGKITKKGIEKDIGDDSDKENQDPNKGGTESKRSKRGSDTDQPCDL